MGENTAISWCDHTFSPWWGCTKVGAGCQHCYAETLAKRFGVGWGPEVQRRIFGDHHWNDPIRWDRKAAKQGTRAKVFCGSMCDVFEDRPELREMRVRLFGMVEETQWLDWLFLTKRPQNVMGKIPSTWAVSFPRNVWLGCTIEDRAALSRLDDLRATPAALRFLSCEPLLEDLGPVDLTGIGWVIAGCESGPHARPTPAGAFESLWMQCRLLEVPFFMKQTMDGGRLNHEPTINGRAWREMPEGAT